MSTRTIIEFNHDYVQDLADKGVIGAELYRLLCWANSAEAERQFAVRGVKVLGQRHHSEELNLKVR